VWVLLALVQTLWLNHHLLNTRTPVWVLLVMVQTLLLNHHLLNARTPVLFLLALGQTPVLNHHLLIALVWTILCLGSIWQTLWYRQQPPRVGEPSHSVRVGYSQARPECPFPRCGPPSSNIVCDDPWYHPHICYTSCSFSKLLVGFRTP